MVVEELHKNISLCKIYLEDLEVRLKSLEQMSPGDYVVINNNAPCARHTSYIGRVKGTEYISEKIGTITGSFDDIFIGVGFMPETGKVLQLDGDSPGFADGHDEMPVDSGMVYGNSVLVIGDEKKIGEYLEELGTSLQAYQDSLTLLNIHKETEKRPTVSSLEM